MLGRLTQTYRDAFAGHSRIVWGLALAALVNRAGTMVLPFLTLYLSTDLGFSPAQTSFVMMVFGAGAVVSSVTGGWATQRFGAIPTMYASLAVTGVVFLGVVPLRSFPAVSIGVFLISGVGDMFRPAVISALAGAADPRRKL